MHNYATLWPNWGLEQSKYFAQGCNDLLVVTDHLPLVKILGNLVNQVANYAQLRDIIHVPSSYRLSQVHRLPQLNHIQLDHGEARLHEWWPLSSGNLSMQ